MSKLFLKLDQFKKIKSDKNTSTFKHKGGHTITVAHSSLTPRMRKEMDEIPHHKEETQKLAKGGKVQAFAEKGEVEIPGVTGGQYSYTPPEETPEYLQGSYTPAPEEPPSAADKTREAILSQWAPSGNRAEPGPNTPTMSLKELGDYAHDALLPDETKRFTEPEITVDKSRGRSPTLLNPNTQPPAPSLGDISSGQAQQQAPSLETGTTSGEPQQPSNRTMQENPWAAGAGATFDEFQKGNQALTAAQQKSAIDQGTVGKDKAKVLGEESKELHKLATGPAQVGPDGKGGTEMDKWRTYTEAQYNFLNDATNKEDSQRFMKSLQSEHPVRTAIALFLGGLGAGLTGTRNDVQDMFDRAIDRDVQSQRDNIKMHENLFTQAMQQFGNEKDAAIVTKSLINNAYMVDLDKISAEHAGTIEGDRAASLAADRRKADAQIVGPMLQRREMFKNMVTTNPTPEGVAAIISNMGTGTDTDKKAALDELNQRQKILKARDNLLDAAYKIAELNTLAQRAGNPLQSRSTINALKGAVLPTLSKETAGRFSEADAKRLDATFSSLSDNADTVDQKIAAINKLAMEKLNFSHLDGQLAPLGIKLPLGKYDANGKPILQKLPLRRQ